MYIYIYIYIYVCIFIYIYTCIHMDTLLTCTDSLFLSPYAHYFALFRTCKHTAGESTDRLGHVEGVDYRDHHNYAESAVAEAIAQARRPLPRPTRAREPGRVADSLVHDVGCAVIRRGHIFGHSRTSALRQEPFWPFLKFFQKESAMICPWTSSSPPIHLQIMYVLVLTLFILRH